MRVRTTFLRLGLALEHLALEHLALERRYRPDQPRVPAGQEGGGRYPATRRMLVIQVRPSR